MNEAAPALAELSYSGHPSTPVRLDEVEWTAAQRMQRALKALGLCWAAAVAAVFLPVLHFVLVPALLLAGPVAALVRHRERRSVLGYAGTCPACGAALEERRALPSHDEVALRCDACGRGLVLRRLTAAGSSSPPRS